MILRDSTSSKLSLNENLSKILQWAYKWKMLFNPDASKQAQEIVFSHKNIPSDNTDIYFNNMPLKNKNTQKHLGLHFDAKLNFSEHLNEIITRSIVINIASLMELFYKCPLFRNCPLTDL